MINGNVVGRVSQFMEQRAGPAFIGLQVVQGANVSLAVHVKAEGMLVLPLSGV